MCYTLNLVDGRPVLNRALAGSAKDDMVMMYFLNWRKPVVDQFLYSKRKIVKQTRMEHHGTPV